MPFYPSAFLHIEDTQSLCRARRKFPQGTKKGSAQAFFLRCPQISRRPAPGREIPRGGGVGAGPSPTRHPTHPPHPPQGARTTSRSRSGRWSLTSYRPAPSPSSAIGPGRPDRPTAPDGPGTPHSFWPLLEPFPFPGWAGCGSANPEPWPPSSLPRCFWSKAFYPNSDAVTPTIQTYILPTQSWCTISGKCIQLTQGASKTINCNFEKYCSLAEMPKPTRHRSPFSQNVAQKFLIFRLNECDYVSQISVTQFILLCNSINWILPNFLLRRRQFPTTGLCTLGVP